MSDARFKLPRIRTNNSVNAAVSMVTKKETPAILALKRGDASANRFIIPGTLILFPHFANR
jgi:hypothetical protein